MSHLKSTTRLFLLVAVLSTLLLAIGSLGLYGITQSNAALKTVYQDRTVAIGLLSDIQHQLLRGRVLVDASVLDPRPQVIAANLAELGGTSAVISKAWAAYKATYLTKEEEKLAAKFEQDHLNFEQQGLVPAVAALRANDIAGVQGLIRDKILPLDANLQLGLEGLMQIQLSVAKQEYQAAMHRYDTVRLVSMAAIAGGVLFAILTGLAVLRARRQELNVALERQSHADMAHQLEEKNKLMQALEESEFRWKFAIEGAGDGVWDRDLQTGQENYSRRCKEMLGYAEDEILPDHREWESRIHPDDRQAVLTSDADYVAGKASRYELEYRLRCKDGSYKWILSRGMIVSRDPTGKPLRTIGTHREITAAKNHEQELERIARYDSLTKLPNRALLGERLEQALNQTRRRGQHLAVVFIDLDGFKAVNDTHGHDAGDHLLITLAERMKGALRDGDILARLGGDEFVAVLLDLADVDASAPMLNRLLEAAARPFQFGEARLQVAASLGVTFYPQAQDQAQELEPDQLLRQADQAMYQAKQSGKNRFHVFDAEQDRNVRARHESMQSIERALSEGGFVLEYQPKVNLRTGAVIGVEALIRWRHPQRGLVPPADFLPMIEDHPLAVKLGQWVIESALAQMDGWREVGLNMAVSVNIGRRHLMQTDFVQRLGEALAAHPGLQPSCLELELLEAKAVNDLDRVAKVIQECRAIGVECALDDFGSGYSSLTGLKKLPVKYLKIEQNFIRDMLDSSDSLLILIGVLKLASAFDLKVIAEGVETAQHGSMLLELGCELAQGFGIARPMSADELPGWVKRWKPDPTWSVVQRVRH